MIALSSLVLLGATDDPHRARRPDSFINRMVKVYAFAFGGVGFGLAISEGEKDYRVMLSRPSAEADFERVFRMGNPQAKCYALVGLRQTNLKRFEALATSLQSSRISVPTMRGCVTSASPMSEIIEDIRTGIYSGPLNQNPIPPASPVSERVPTSQYRRLTEEGWIDLIRRLFPSTLF